MTLEQQIKQDMKTYLKNKETEKLNIIRLLVSEFQRKSNPHIDLTDKEVIAIINKMIKSEQELLKYKNETTSSFITILEEYLPKQLSKDDIIKEIKETFQHIIDLPANQRMKQMGTLIKHFGTATDGNTLKSILMEI